MSTDERRARGREGGVPGRREPCFWVAVPLYQNARTIRRVVEQLLEQDLPVLVVDDGSTDRGSVGLEDLGVTVLRHEINRGKGAAIMTAARYAFEKGATHLVVFDGDGQLFAGDVAEMIAVARDNPRAIVCGVRDFEEADVPRSSRFGRRFSNFWARAIGGVAVRDSQSGFRVYPICLLLELPVRATRYDFEVEILVRAAWGGTPIVECPVRVTYDPPEGRVTSFRMLLDNARITATNTRLFLRMMLPVPAPQVSWSDDGWCRLVSMRRPGELLRWAISENGSPGRLAVAVGLGLLIGTLPLVGVHTVAVLAAASMARVNRLSAVLASQFCAPPVVPAFAFATGHWLLGYGWCTDVAGQAAVLRSARLVGEYVLGAVVLAPVLAVVGGLLTWGLASMWPGNRSRRRPGKREREEARRVLTGRYGPRAGIFFFRVLLLIVGVRVTRWLAWPVVVVYYCRSEIRNLVRPYVVRRFRGRGRVGLFVAGLRLLWEFAGLLIDQAALARGDGRSVSLRVEEQDALRAILEDGRGKVLLLSHFGNWKVPLPEATRLAGRLHLLMEEDPAEPARRSFEGVGVISPREGPRGLVRATTALLRGEAVAIMADRPWNGVLVGVDLLGDTAWLPASPYRLAISTGSWLVMLLVVPDGPGRYRLVHRVILEADQGADTVVPRRLEDVAAAYGSELGKWLERYPYHWFNFVDVWARPSGRGRRAAARTAARRRMDEHRAGAEGDHHPGSRHPGPRPGGIQR